MCGHGERRHHQCECGGEEHGHDQECGCGGEQEERPQHDCGCGHGAQPRHDDHGCGCGCHVAPWELERPSWRRFSSRQERIAWLERYLQELRAEAQAVEEQIGALKTGQ